MVMDTEPVDGRLARDVVVTFSPSSSSSTPPVTVENSVTASNDSASVVVPAPPPEVTTTLSEDRNADVSVHDTDESDTQTDASAADAPRRAHAVLS